MNDMSGLRIGYAMTGSFCTFSRSFEAAQKLRDMGAQLVPVMSDSAANTNTRFGKAVENLSKLSEICGTEVITTIAEAEPIGPKNMTDIMVVAPCTSNTAVKLACGITDTPVTMAVKSHLRSGKPVLLAIASNDSLMGSARNIGELFSRKYYYFVPMLQDDPVNKPTSLVAQFDIHAVPSRPAESGVRTAGSAARTHYCIIADRPLIFHNEAEN